MVQIQAQAHDWHASVCAKSSATSWGHTTATGSDLHISLRLTDLPQSHAAVMRICLRFDAREEFIDGSNCTNTHRPVGNDPEEVGIRGEPRFAAISSDSLHGSQSSERPYRVGDGNDLALLAAGSLAFATG